MDSNIYLLPYEDTNYDSIVDILSGDKQVFHFLSFV